MGALKVEIYGGCGGTDAGRIHNAHEEIGHGVAGSSVGCQPRGYVSQAAVIDRQCGSSRAGNDIGRSRQEEIRSSLEGVLTVVPRDYIDDLIVVVPTILGQVRCASDGGIPGNNRVWQTLIVRITGLREVGSTRKAGIGAPDFGLVFLDTRLHQAFESKPDLVQEVGAEDSVPCDICQLRMLVREASALGNHIRGAYAARPL